VERVVIAPDLSPREVERLPEAGLTIRCRDHGRPSRLRRRSLMSYVTEDA
jgi:hypothetical protein